MGFYIKKKVEQIPQTTNKEVEGAEVWMVSWDARFGEYSGNKKRAAKAFLNYEDAEKFKQSLIKAKELLQYTERIDIRVEKQI